MENCSPPGILGSGKISWKVGASLPREIETQKQDRTVELEVCPDWRGQMGILGLGGSLRIVDVVFH